MTLREVKEALDAEVIVGHDQLDLEVTKGGCSDMMSDVLVYCTSGSLLLTGLNNSQIVHTASIIDLAGIVMVRGKHPFPETIQLAEKLRIPILTTKYILFETVVRLHSKGIVSCIKKVGEKCDLS
ncbi:MAG: DRTGG domain-containing protein [Syntrophorhabdus sp.]|nr:DRTGG domain-containing protein [Syntrophaceae bacterium]